MFFNPLIIEPVIKSFLIKLNKLNKLTKKNYILEFLYIYVISFSTQSKFSIFGNIKITKTQHQTISNKERNFVSAVRNNTIQVKKT